MRVFVVVIFAFQLHVHEKDKRRMRIRKEELKEKKNGMQNEITTCINVLNLLISCQSHHHKRISFYEIHSLVFTCVVRIRVVFINYGTFDKMQNFDKGKSRVDVPTGCYGL